MPKYRSGKLSLSEWDGPWKSDPAEDDSYYETEEYEDESETKREEFLRYFAQTFGNIVPEKVYPLGDDRMGDRTEYLYVLDPALLTPAFIEGTQAWLKIPGNESWRVLIGTTDSPHTTILIYSDCVRISENYEKDLSEGINLLRAEMLVYYRQNEIGIFYR